MGEVVNLMSVDVYLEILHEIMVEDEVEVLRHTKPTLKRGI